MDKEQTHRLSSGHAASADALAQPRWRPPAAPRARSLKSGELSTPGMTTRAITARKVLGEQIGIVGLSAHDCRHYWATQAAQRHGRFRAA
ncbi:MAG: hypothetical protein R3A10_07405 [Caldilineaceae bacterium]